MKKYAVIKNNIFVGITQFDKQPKKQNEVRFLEIENSEVLKNPKYFAYNPENNNLEFSQKKKDKFDKRSARPTQAQILKALLNADENALNAFRQFFADNPDLDL